LNTLRDLRFSPTQGTSCQTQELPNRLGLAFAENMSNTSFLRDMFMDMSMGASVYCFVWCLLGLIFYVPLAEFVSVMVVSETIVTNILAVASAGSLLLFCLVVLLPRAGW
jgi:hypothetical protein